MKLDAGAMLGMLFRRAAPPAGACALGTSVVALPLRSGCAAPPGCPVVIIDAKGATRRAPDPRRPAVREGELACVFHPGPYTVDIVPFAQAPEIGLRTTFAVDAADPQAAHQRFDLYLSSEVPERLELAALAEGMQATLQRELAHGGLELPPCAGIEEWNAFRLGLNQLLYMRYGVTVDDCVPVDLGATRDYARDLRARAAAQPAASLAVPADAAPSAAPGGTALADPGAAAPGGTAAPACGAARRPASAALAGADDAALRDARALRRLFLELPCLMCGLRLAALPVCPEQFRRQQALLQRMDLLSVGAASMPAFSLAAPGQALAIEQRLRRVRHSQRACASLDDAWALLARMKEAPAALARHRLAALYDEAERIVANLETDCAGRRAARPPAEGAERAMERGAADAGSAQGGAA